MDSQPPRSRRRIVVAVIVAVVIVAASLAAYDLTSSSTACPTITAAPGRLSLRVVSDSNQTPVSGAQVTATSMPAGYIPASCQGPQTTLRFTTNSTEWYPLNAASWPGGFSLVVEYSGQTYSFTVSLPVMELVCASLYIPSGATNTTNAGVSNSCPSTVTTTSTS